MVFTPSRFAGSKNHKRLTMRVLVKTALCLLLAVACGKPADAPEAGVPGVPENLKFHSSTDNSLTFQWTAVDGATSYEWKLTGEGSFLKEGTSAKRNVTVDGLTPGTTYSFSVQAVNAAGKSGFCVPQEGTTTGTAPELPGPEGPDAPSSAVCVDAPLAVEVGSGASLGTSGLIQVFKKDGTLVDKIDMADIAKVTILEDGTMVPKEKINYVVDKDTKEVTYASVYNTFMDAIPCSGYYRIVHYTPLRIKGNQLQIKLHGGVLAFSQSYYLTMDPEVIDGHAGIAAGEYEFTTKSAPSSDKELTVDADGRGDFCTIQGALSYVNKSGGKINVSNGTYPELLYLRGKENVQIVGSSLENVIVAYPNYESYEGGVGSNQSSVPVVGKPISSTGGRAVFLIENCDNLSLEGITIHNTIGQQGQAECIYANSGNYSHRLSIKACALLSLQDTFNTKAKTWITNSIIAGNVDFIWGSSVACFIENSEIRCEYGPNGGYIVQARCTKASDPGFVFYNCNITTGTGAKEGSIYLARSSGSASYFDNVTFVNCKMSSVIAPQGWFTNPKPNPEAPTATSGWKEYGTTGVSTASRNSYGKILTAAEAEAYASKEAVLP